MGAAAAAGMCQYQCYIGGYAVPHPVCERIHDTIWKPCAEPLQVPQLVQQGPAWSPLPPLCPVGRMPVAPPPQAPNLTCCSTGLCSTVLSTL